VSGALLESPRKLPPAEDEVTLQFTLIAQPGNQQVIVTTRASIRNVHVLQPAPERSAAFTYGVQFIDLDPTHYILLQNLTYEAMLADRQKIV
jgi:c-di-GMP-binding flagellar brake protein YcgR